MISVISDIVYFFMLVFDQWQMKIIIIVLSLASTKGFIMLFTFFTSFHKLISVKFILFYMKKNKFYYPVVLKFCKIKLEKLKTKCVKSYTETLVHLICKCSWVVLCVTRPIQKYIQLRIGISAVICFIKTQKLKVLNVNSPVVFYARTFS